MNISVGFSVTLPGAGSLLLDFDVVILNGGVRSFNGFVSNVIVPGLIFGRTMLGKLIKLKKNSELSSSSFPVSSLHVFIGSDKNCDIRILKAAPQHCIITVEEGKLATVRNLATNDPTLLNGSQMDGFDHNLVNKDIISVLDKRFMWEYPSSS
ncbi:hypothetical protein AAG570_009502 [Ranatra chinensis]|uniref:FHA domain-containing protein n=1 Tax=Ranatra chinensis TaxID=642074 RepID=A0ABD0YPA1_9HEMI